MARFVFGVSFSSSEEIVCLLASKLGYILQGTKTIGTKERLDIFAGLDENNISRGFLCEKECTKESNNGQHITVTEDYWHYGGCAIDDTDAWIVENNIVETLFEKLTSEIPIRTKNNKKWFPLISQYFECIPAGEILLFGYSPVCNVLMTTKKLKSVKKLVKEHFNLCGLPGKKVRMYAYNPDKIHLY
jgi:hypothetical protein